MSRRFAIDARLPYFRDGGIATYVTSLVEALAAIDTEDRFTILHARNDRTTRFPDTAGNFERVDIDTPCHHPRERLLLAAELRPYGFDLLHSPDFIPPAFGARRRVITIHDLSFVDEPGRLSSAARRHYAGQLSWAIETAHGIATPSEHVRQRVIRECRVPSEIVAATPLAASTDFAPIDDASASQTWQRYGLAAGYVLFVGTVEPRKNLALLIAVHDALSARDDITAPLVLAGPPGWLADDVLAMAAERPKSIRLLGHVPRDDLRCLYAGAAVLALPSFDEGFGLPLVEAMSCGCPVVASNRGALPEVAEDAAVLLDPDDRDGWTRALSKILNDGGVRDELRKRGLARARQFSWQRTATQTLDLYRNAMTG